MARPRNIQQSIHWLEVGEGARWIRRGAILFAIALLSVLVAWKQFHGATAEATLLQADVGRQLANGAGFTTLVNYPQAAAFLEKRGRHFDAGRPYPELYEAPFYSMVIAGALRLLPADARDALFQSAPIPPDGFRGDYFLLGLNLVLLWLTAWLTFDLARRLFDVRSGWLAMLALLASVGIWQQTIVVNGAPLLMLLAVAAFWIWTRIEELIGNEENVAGEENSRGQNGHGERERAEAGSLAPGATRSIRLAHARRDQWLLVLGGICGLLFLTEYSAGALVVVALGYVLARFSGRDRWRGLIAVSLGFALVSGFWIARNLAVSGHPTALAAQNIALKFGDPTAEPATQRNMLSAVLPGVMLNKLGNKTLASLQENLKTRVWAGGAMWLMAFFVSSWLYGFRSPVVNRLRWIFCAAFVVLLVAQSAFNSGESERLAAGWLAPVVMVFGAGFFFVLLGSNSVLREWPRLCAAVLLVLQALPLVHDALEPRRLHFQYPPYFPGLFIGVRQELARRDHVGRFGVMADVPAGMAWYARQRAWSQPVKLRDFYAITLEQPLAALVLTPRTLDRPFFSELEARPVEPDSLRRATHPFGEWGRIYAGLLTGALPPEFPLSVPQKFSDNLYVLFNPALPPPREK